MPEPSQSPEERARAYRERKHHDEHKGKGDQPDLEPGDDQILDEVWDRIGAERRAAREQSKD